MKIKTCNKCKIEKPLSEFHKNSSNKDGLSYTCKECRRLIRKSNYAENKTEILKQNKKYQMTHKAERKSNNKKYYQKHKEAKKKYDIRYRITHQEEIKSRMAKYFQANKEKLYLCHRNLLNNNISHKIAQNIRSRLYMALNHKVKSQSTLKLLGCSIKFLKKYLESKFKPGMAWENYGRGFNGKGKQEWHIDHIKPCCKFDLSKKEEKQKCFHYTNLQPLWAEENIKKGGRI